MKIAFKKSSIQAGAVTVGDLPIFLLSLLIVICEVPIWARNVSNIVFYGLFALFLISTTRFIKEWGKNNSILILYIILYFFLLAVYKILNISSASFAYYSTTVKALLFVFPMIGMINYLSINQKRFLIAVIIGTASYTMLDNVRIFFQYGAFRFTRLFQTERFTTNSVNTAYVYALIFFSGALFVYFRSAKKKMVLRWAALALAVLAVLFDVLIAQRMNALVLVFFMFPLLIISGKKNIGIRMIYIILVMMLLIAAVFFYDPILSWLSRLIDTPRISLRIEQIRTMIASESISEAGGSLAGRTGLIIQSIRTAFGSVISFFFGVGDHRSNNQIIGNHSQFFDEFAKYGLVGMFIWVPMLKQILLAMTKASLRATNNLMRRQLEILQATYILRGFIGGIFEATITIQVFLFIPLIFNLLEQQSLIDD